MARKDELTERVRREWGKSPDEIIAELERHVRSPRKRPGAHFGRVFNVAASTVPVAKSPPPAPLTDNEIKAALQNVHPSERESEVRKYAGLEWRAMNTSERRRWSGEEFYTAARVAQLTDRLAMHTGGTQYLGTYDEWKARQ